VRCKRGRILLLSPCLPRPTGNLGAAPCPSRLPSSPPGGHRVTIYLHPHLAGWLAWTESAPQPPHLNSMLRAWLYAASSRVMAGGSSDTSTRTSSECRKQVARSRSWEGGTRRDASAAGGG
jgi:hypothetical protein